METLKSLRQHLDRPIITRIMKQFGNIEVDVPIDENKSNAQLFFELTKNRGTGKSHCSNRYPKHEGKVRNS